MTDFKGIYLWLLSWVAKRLFWTYAFTRSSIISIKDKKWGDYTFGLAIGNDIYGNKLIAPYANKYWIKHEKKVVNGILMGPRLYGGNETISECMAWNKKHGFNTEKADKWENKVIEKFDKNHLNEMYQDMTKEN